MYKNAKNRRIRLLKPLLITVFCLLVVILSSLSTMGISNNIFERIYYENFDNRSAGDVIPTQLTHWTNSGSSAGVVVDSPSVTNKSLNGTIDGVLHLTIFDENTWVDMVQTDGLRVEFIWGTNANLNNNRISMPHNTLGDESLFIERRTGSSNITVRSGTGACTIDTQIDTGIPHVDNQRDVYVIEQNSTGQWLSINGIEVLGNATDGHTPDECDVASIGFAIGVLYSGTGVSQVDEFAIYNMSSIITPPPPPLNNPPTQTKPLIVFSDTPRNNTIANITLLNQSTFDNESDLVKNIYDYRLEGSSLMVLNAPFEGNSSTNPTVTTTDFSSNDLPSTLSNVVWNDTQGYDGFGTYYFNGTAEITYTTMDDLGVSGHATFMAWAKLDTGTSCSQITPLFADGASGQNGIMLDRPGCGRIQGRGDATSALNGTIIEPVGFNENVWNHYALISTPTSGVLLLNGEIIDNNSDSWIPVSIDDNWMVGQANPTRTWKGFIDEVMVFNRSLSVDQVRNVYKNKSSELHFQETILGQSFSGCVTPIDGEDFGVTNCTDSVQVALDTNNITITQPLPLEIFNTSSVNVTVVTGGDATCNISHNGTGTFVVYNEGLSFIDGISQQIDVDISPAVLTTRADIKVQCGFVQQQLNENVTIIIDRKTPDINVSSPLNGDLFSTDFLYNITCTDNNLFEFEGTFTNNNGSGVITHGFSFLNLTGDITKEASGFFTNSSDHYRMDVNCSDGHTNNNIDGLNAIDRGSSIDYEYEGVVLSETVTSSIEDYSFERQSDRIVTRIKSRSDKAFVSSKTVTCDEPFKKVSGSTYRDHVVCGKMWWDSEDDDPSSSTLVNWISPYEFVITTSHSTGETLTRSIGVLNTNSATTYFTIDKDAPNVTLQHVNNSIFNGFGTKKINYNVTDLTVVSCNLLADFDNDNVFEVNNPGSSSDGISFVSDLVVPNANGTFTYQAVCTDEAGHIGYSLNLTGISVFVAPYTWDFSFLWGTDFDITTTSGILFYVMLVLLWFMFLFLAEKMLNPLLYVFTAFIGFIITVLTFYRVSIVLGFIWAFAIVFVIYRMNEVDHTASKRNDG